MSIILSSWPYFFNYGDNYRLAVGGRYLCPKENSILMCRGYLRQRVTSCDFVGTRIAVLGNISFLDKLNFSSLWSFLLIKRYFGARS